jgi:hypothetical protein
MEEAVEDFRMRWMKVFMVSSVNCIEGAVLPGRYAEGCRGLQRERKRGFIPRRNK